LLGTTTSSTRARDVRRLFTSSVEPEKHSLSYADPMRTGTEASSGTADQSLTTDQVHEMVALICEARESAKVQLGHDFWYLASTDEEVQAAMAIAWTRSFDLVDLTVPATGGGDVTWRLGDDLPAHIPQWERGRFDYDRQLAGRPVSASVVRALHTLQTLPERHAASGS
jgi:hypothetical protein